MISSCSLINSGSINLKFKKAKANFDGRQYEKKKNSPDFSFSVRNVQHPKRYGAWASNIRLSPSIHYDQTTFSTDNTRTGLSGNSEGYPDIKYKRLSSFLNLKFANHTPIGQFVLTGGYGIAGYKVNDGEGLTSKRTQDIQKIDFAWVGFLSDKFFLLLGPRYYNDGTSQVVFAIRLGYFWGRQNSS